MIHVFIVAASSLARAGLQSLVGTRDVEVVGTAPNIESITGQLPDLEADVVLSDAPGEKFERLLDALTESQLASEIAFVVLSDNVEPKSLADALRAGVRAVLPSNIAPEQLFAALQAASAGLVVVHPTEIDAAFPDAQPASRPLAELSEPLTPRESEVLQMLASGFANKEIARQLAISEHTVKFHVASILGKLGAGSRTEAVALGIRRGLVLL